MDKKLPRIVALPITKKVGNNRDLFYSAQFEKKEDLLVRKESETPPHKKGIDEILDSINQVFHSTHHSFYVPVEITTKEKTYNTRLAGKFGNKILTMDDDEIFISDILDFKIK